MVRGGIAVNLAIGGGEEISQGITGTHAAIGQHRRWSMAGDAVLPLGYISGALAGVGLAQLIGHIALRLGMFAGHPRVVKLVIVIGETKIPVPLPAHLTTPL